VESALLELDLHLDTGRQVETLQAVDGLRLRIDDVDEPLVDPHLEVLARVLVDVGSADDGVPMLVGRQRYGATHRGVRTSNGLDDLARRLIDDLVIESLEADSDDLSHVGHRLT